MRSNRTDKPVPKIEDNVAQPRILVVEDDFLIRMMLVEVLADDGFVVAEADNGNEALAMLKSGIDLVVTDVQLAGPINGHELVALARQTNPNLPAIYTSGRGTSDTPRGDRDVSIAKPYQAADIAAAIRQMLAA